MSMCDDITTVIFRIRDPLTGVEQVVVEDIYHCDPWRTLQDEAQKRAKELGAVSWRT